MARSSMRHGWLHWRKVLPDDAWPPERSEQPRVLLECPDHASPAVLAHVLGEDGYEVTVCRGPHGRRACAAVETGCCELVEGADVVVNLIGFQNGKSEILTATRAAHPGVPIVAEVTVPEAAAHDGEFDGVTVLHPPYGLDGLVGAIETARGLRPG